MHGLPIYMHWVILFFHVLFLRAITALLITWALYQPYQYGALVRESNPFVIFVFLWTHLISLSFFNFFIAVVTSSRKKNIQYFF